MARKTYKEINRALPITLVDNQLVTVPASGGVMIPVNPTYDYVLLEVLLTDADKLATGNTLLFNFLLSEDHGANWQFVAGIDWVSYGPGGHTIIDPDGTQRVNPNPRMFLPAQSIKGNLVRVQYLSAGLSTAGLSISSVN